MNTERYQRHSLIDWFSQEAISNMSVCVVGAGAVGNEVIKNLVLLGVGKLNVFDFDHIEIHNLTRSVLFRETDIGRAKAEVAAERARELNPNVTVISHIGDIWDTYPISGFGKFDIVFCCVDNFEARIRLNKICYLASVDMVNVGIDSRFASIEVFPFSRNPLAPCFECTLPPSVYARIAERYSCGWLKKISFVEGKVPTTAVTASISAGIAVSSGLRLGDSNAQSAGTETTRMFFDTISCRSQFSVISNKKNDCPCCGMFAPAVAIVRSSPTLCDSLFTELGIDRAGSAIWSSDPILTGYEFVNEDGTREFTTVFERASDHDDQFARKLSDDPNKVLVEIRDQFQLEELKNKFYGKILPAKFIIMECEGHTYVLDLEGEECV